MDLQPEDIKDPEDAPPAGEPAHEAPADEEEEDEEAPKAGPDLAAAVEHLTVAVGELARASGSPPGVLAALQNARTALGR